ncbi:hypothetical protein ACFQY4_24030 [Catellatospora bangladeshensis]|uniref:hypothetical protein n=1 Tax=Catellatospora bangladeshensis TaxID=310355 RepID=UPI003616077E
MSATDTSHDLDTMGPVDYLVIEFPGNKMTGEGIPLLLDLVDRGIVRILDLAFIRKDADGTISAIRVEDMDAAGAREFAVFQGRRPGCWAATTCRRRPTRSSPATRPGS